MSAPRSTLRRQHATSTSRTAASARRTPASKRRWASNVAFCYSDDVHLPFRLSAHTPVSREGSPCPRRSSAIYAPGMATARSRSMSTLARTPRVRSGPVRGTFDEAVAAPAFGTPTTARALGIPLRPELADRTLFRAPLAPAPSPSTTSRWVAPRVPPRGARRCPAMTPRCDAEPDWGLASKLSKSYELSSSSTCRRCSIGNTRRSSHKQSRRRPRCYFHVARRVWLNDPVFRAQFPDERDSADPRGDALRMGGRARAHRKSGGKARRCSLAPFAPNPKSRSRLHGVAALRPSCFRLRACEAVRGGVIMRAAGARLHRLLLAPSRDVLATERARVPQLGTSGPATGGAP